MRSDLQYVVPSILLRNIAIMVVVALVVGIVIGMRL